MEEKYICFLEKKVAVEIKSWNDDSNTRTFVYYGIVKEVYDDSILLERNGKKTLLKYSRIVEVREE